MPASTTTYSFQKPTVGGDGDAWGGYLNTNFDTLDDVLDGTSPITPATGNDIEIRGTNAATNSVTTLLTLNSQSSNTPANGIGSALAFAAETAAGNTEIGVVLEAVTTDVTAASEDFDLVIKTMSGGATAAERLRVSSSAISMNAVRSDSYTDASGGNNATFNGFTPVPSVGQVAFFALNTAPTGWLKANGAAVSRTTYAALFAAIGTTFGAGDGSTTFNLPDLRGEFIRGWDDGRGIDSGRVFGSFQDHAIQNHRHDIVVNQTSTGSSERVMRNSSAATGGDQTNTAAIQTTGSVGNFAAETRPRNVALLACIKF